VARRAKAGARKRMRFRDRKSVSPREIAAIGRPKLDWGLISKFDIVKEGSPVPFARGVD
jgi:hypothetical protein